MTAPDSEGTKPTDATDVETEVTFHYLKSHHFRVLTANGAFGGITPAGNVLMTLFSERLPLPEMTVHRLRPDGSLAGELRDRRKSKSGVVREYEVAVVMDLRASKAVFEWLKGKIAQLESLSAEPEAK